MYKIKVTDETTSPLVMRKIAKIDSYNNNNKAIINILNEFYLDYFKAFSDGFVLAYESTRVIGYLHWVPVSKDHYNKVKSADNKYKCIPKISDIVPFNDEGNHILIKDIGVYEKCRYAGVGTALLDMFCNIMINGKFAACLNKVIAPSYSEEGHSLLRKRGFNIINGVSESFSVFEKEI